MTGDAAYADHVAYHYAPDRPPQTKSELNVLALLHARTCSCAQKDPMCFTLVLMHYLCATAFMRLSLRSLSHCVWMRARSFVDYCIRPRIKLTVLIRAIAV